MTESYWQKLDNTTDRRPVIIVVQGFYQDIGRLRVSYQIDPQKTDIVDILQAKYIVKDIGVLEEKKSLKMMVEDFGLGPIEHWYLHNAVNDAVMTLIVALLAGMKEKLHPGAPTGFPSPPILLGVWPMLDLFKQAEPIIKANSYSGYDITVFCVRCEFLDHMASNCGAVFSPCVACGSTEHLHAKCITHVWRDPCYKCQSRVHLPEACWTDKANRKVEMEMD
jgi:hypothetical protein